MKCIGSHRNSDSIDQETAMDVGGSEVGKVDLTVAVSVITVTYNAAPLLRATMDSVLAQDCNNMEHIVVDGKSDDETAALIEEKRPAYKAKGMRLIFISEIDAGIYDAMNKGMRHAQGCWLNFLNTGDTYASSRAISWILQHPEFDCICGSARTVDANGYVLGVAAPVEKLSLDAFRAGSGVCHQAWFQRSNLAPQYDLRFTLSADYRWIIDCFKASRRCMTSKQVLVNYLYGGKSKKNYFITLCEKVVITRVVFGVLPAVKAALWMPGALLRARILGPLKHYTMRKLGCYQKL